MNDIICFLCPLFLRHGYSLGSREILGKGPHSLAVDTAVLSSLPSNSDQAPQEQS